MGKKKIETVENVEILEAVAEGNCITKINDKAVFVKHAAPGDVVTLEVRHKRKRFAEGTIKHISTPSPLRVDPTCEHFGVCGGCKWQHLDYEAQLASKHKQVKDNLERLGGLTLPEMDPILAAPEKYYYRNKVEFTFSNKKWLTLDEINSGDEFDRRSLGFHVPGRFDKVLDINQCHLATPISDKIRNHIKAYCLKENLSFFDLVEQKGIMRNVMIRHTDLGELMVVVSFHKKEDVIFGLLENLKDNFPEITALMYVINEKRNDTIGDLDIITYHGNDCIYEEMEGLKFKIGPKSFYQTNSKQAYELYKVVREFANPNQEDVMYDLYTGTGTIALFMAKMVQKVVGIEYVEEAVIAAHENAAHNNITNSDFYAGDMKDVLNDEFIAQHGKPTLVVTDPPRAGMHDDVVATIRRMAAKKVVYVSCNPGTQARDLKALDDLYEIKRVMPVDMFPHTHHVENVVLLELRP